MTYFDEEDDTTAYALTWHSPEGHPMYWSLRKGWTPNDREAWVLSASEIDNIENEERLLSKLPQHKERRDGANWEPIYRRLVPYARGVLDDDDYNFLEDQGDL